MSDDETQYVCFACIRDHYLETEIKRNDEQHCCMICDIKRASIKFDELCERVHNIVREEFAPTSSEPEYGWGMYKEAEIDWEREGSDIVEVLHEIVESEPELLNQIKVRLSDLHFSYDDAMDGVDNPYGDEVRYEARKPNDYELRDDWSLFQNEIRTRSRFFSSTAEAVLGRIFGGLQMFKTIDRQLIRDAGPDATTHQVFRARRAFGHDEIAKIVENPAKELGAPPSHAAGSGRMNPRWISMFYGAFDPDTCVAELRAPVGSAVVIGRFDIVRPLYLLDLDAFRQLFVDKASYFDPKYRGLRDKARFLKRLVGIMSRPVMPTDEDYQYLPTQAVAEYLSEKIEPKLDGLIFPSSQRGGKGENVVLFRRASAVEPDGTDALQSETSFGWATEDDEDTDVTVWTKKKPEEKERLEDGWSTWPLPKTESGAKQAALRIDLNQIEIRDVTAVEYTVKRRSVRRYTKPDLDQIDF